MIQRRNFLRNLSLAAVAVAVRPAIATDSYTAERQQAAPNRQQPATERLSAANFSQHAGSEFYVAQGLLAGQSLVLTEVVKHDYDEKLEGFTLKLSGEPDRPLPESIHRVSHRELGEMEVAIHARGVVAGKCRYSISFCRFV